jgi:phospholipase C
MSAVVGLPRRLARRAPVLVVVVLAGLWAIAIATAHTASAASGPTAAPAAKVRSFGNTTTPIKHVIIIIGENHTFDNVFATYQPPSGQTVRNLLSEGIVNADGTPGPNFSKAAQQTATDTRAQGCRRH